MKSKISSLGRYEYRFSDLIRLEKLGFVFEKSNKLRFAINDEDPNSYWWSKITEPKDFVEFSTLEELVNFTNEYGDCIICDGCIVINDEDRDR